MQKLDASNNDKSTDYIQTFYQCILASLIKTTVIQMFTPRVETVILIKITNIHKGAEMFTDIWDGSC